MFAALSVMLAQPVLGREPVPDTLLRQFAARFQAKDCAGVVAQVTAPAFATMTASLVRETLLWVDQAGIYCARQEKRQDIALTLALQATALPGAPQDLWNERLYLQWGHSDYAAVVGSIEQMAEQAPQALNAAPAPMLWQFNRELKNKGETDLRRRYLKVLAAPGHVPDKIGETADVFRFDYARLAMAAGDKASAMATMALVTSPLTLIRASVDPQLRGFVPADFDARVAIEAEMARYRELAAAHQRVLRLIISIVKDQQMLGEDTATLATLDEARPDAAGADYEDGADQVNWWWNAEAYAEAHLGHFDKAAAAMRHGIDSGEYGRVNVSQSINLAGLASDFGRYADALAALAPLKEHPEALAPYGRMQLYAERARAELGLGHTSDARADLDYLRAHVDDAPQTVAELLALSGDMDGAAAIEIGQLASPQTSAEALLDFCDFAPPPATRPRNPEIEALLKLRQRADVQAAITKAGGTRSFDIPRSNYL